MLDNHIVAGSSITRNDSLEYFGDTLGSMTLAVQLSSANASKVQRISQIKALGRADGRECFIGDVGRFLEKNSAH